MKVATALILSMVCVEALNFIPVDYGRGHVHKRTAPPSSHLTVVVSAFKENVTWLHRMSRYDVHMYGHAGGTVFENMVPLNKGAEASAYLSYIINNWHALPPRIAFIEANEKSWHQKHDMVARIAQCMKSSKAYIGLNMYRIDTAYFDTVWNYHLFKPVWDGVLRPHVHTECPRRIVADGSGQFMVTADAIRRWPLIMYEDLYAYAVGTKRWEGDAGWRDRTGFSYKPGGPSGPTGAESSMGGVFFIEWIWGFLFGDTFIYEKDTC